MTILDRAIGAWRREFAEWGCRTSTSSENKTLAEIYRHSERGVVSPVVKATVGHAAADVMLNELRDVACMRAAIEAMREPDGTMVAAAQWGTVDGAGVDVDVIWHAMIDAALS
jgi:hypothetical protein